jgi:hypothetical protein
MKEVFPIAPAGPSAYMLLVPIGLLLLAGLAFVILTATAMGRGSVEVSPGEIRIRAPFYGRTVPVASIDCASARVVDLTTEGDLRPRWRTNGIGLPGYGAGWFKLRNGERALLLVTDKSRVLYLPTREGYSILLSASEPQKLLEAIRKNGAPA